MWKRHVADLEAEMLKRGMLFESSCVNAGQPGTSKFKGPSVISSALCA
jgi:hypothetical protein